MIGDGAYFAFRPGCDRTDNRSSVFRDMLTIDSSSKEIHLPESGSDLRLFFRALVPTAKCVPPHGPEFIEADYLDLIGLLIKYDCATIARSELYNLVKITRADLFFDWFVLASRLNSIESACRLLVQGWKSFRSHKGPLQIPTSTPLCFIHESRWAPEETKQINPEWVGALAYASMTVQHQINPGRSA